MRWQCASTRGWASAPSELSRPMSGKASLGHNAKHAAGFCLTFKSLLFTLEVKSKDPMSLVSKISGKGQVTIPKKVRDSLGAAPGDLIAYEIKGNLVTLKRLDPFDAAYHMAV